MFQTESFWLLLIISLATADNIVSVDRSVGVTKYCRDKERLITSDEIDEYLLINAEIDSIVMMECHFCNDKEEKQTKIWYYQDRYREISEKVVELGMENNMSYNRIYTTPDLSLVIKHFEVADAGIYLCHGEEGQEAENKFNYRIEPVFKDSSTSVHTEKGNLTEWEKYREIYLATITTRFAVSQMSELVEIRDVGIALHVISEWAPWSPCEDCIGNRGYKSSVGRCRLKRFMNMTIANNSDSSIIKFFRKFPLLPCKSILLEQEFPGVSTAIRYLPDFILKEECKKCVGSKKKSRKYRYVKRFVLTEGAYLTVVCPESSVDTQVTWKKDSITLEKGVRRSFRKLDPNVHLVVDAFGTLYLIDASIDEGGNYTCAVDKVNMMQLKVVVVSKSRLLTQEFFRHLGYLGFVFFLCLLCYCSGLIHTCRRNHRFQQRTPVKLAEKGGTGEDGQALLANQETDN